MAFCDGYREGALFFFAGEHKIKELEAKLYIPVSAKKDPSPCISSLISYNCLVLVFPTIALERFYIHLLVCISVLHFL